MTTTPTPGTRCHIATDEPHNGSPDVRRFPPSLVEISAAVASLRDSSKAPDLFRICGSLERCEVVLAIVAGLAARKWEAAA